MSNVNTVYAALPTKASGDWTTSALVAKATGMSGATVDKWLKALRDEQRVSVKKDGRTTLYQQIKPGPKLAADSIVQPKAASVPAKSAKAPAKAAKTAKPVTGIRRARGNAKPSESDATAPARTRVPRAPAAAQTPGGGVGAVVGYLESVRPVSAAPAETPRRTRVARDPDAPRPEYAVWRPGELQVAITTHLRALPEGESMGPNAVARALNSQAGSVAFALNALVVRGEVKKVSVKPPRFAAA